MLDTLLLCASLLIPPGAGDDLGAAREKLAGGETDAAIELLQGMLDRHEGTDQDVRLLMAQAQMQAGAPALAKDALRPLLEKDDYDVQLAAGRAFRAWGDQMLAQGRKAADTDFAYEQGLAHLVSAARLAPPGNDEAALEAGYFEVYTAGSPAAAIARADALLKSNAENGEALLLRGCAGLQVAVAAENAGEEPEAAVARSRAIQDLVAADGQLQKTRVEPWVQLAWLYEADGQGLKAVDAAVRILDRTESSDFGTLYHLATRYAAERNFDAAAGALVAMAKRDAPQLTALIQAEEGREGGPGKEQVALEFAWSTAPLANAMPARFADARAVLAAIVAAEPQSADVWNNYGFVCRETAQNDLAYEAYARALELDPANPRLLNDLAVMLHYYLHRDYDKALELYGQAVEQADEQLKAPDLDASIKRDLEEARKDAVNNLKKLAAGDYEWAP